MSTHIIKIFLSAIVVLLLPSVVFAQQPGTSIVGGNTTETGRGNGDDGMLSKYFVSMSSFGEDSPAGYSSLINDATQAYNASKYADAVLKFDAAIQLAPWLPEAYKNLARAYFYLSEYPTAAYYYNIYLNSPQIDRSKVTDTDSVQKEFKMALSNIPGEAVPIENPKRDGYQTQYQSLKDTMSLDQSTDGNMGKPWGAYKALLRANFATPELVAIRNNLANMLAVYIHTKLAPPVGMLTPNLRIEDLRALGDRAFELRSVCINTAQRAWAEQQQIVIKAMMAVATHNVTQAYTYLDSAIEKNPDLTYLVWYKVALLFDDKQYDQALQLMDSHMARESVRLQSVPDVYVDTIRAAIQHARGNNIAASQGYWRIIGDAVQQAMK